MVSHPAFTVGLAGVISALMVLGCASTVRRPTGGEPVCTTGGAAGIDTSGAEAFLAIAEELAKDHDPGEQAWARLEESPGYAVLLKEEFPRDHFRRAFRVALLPSKEAERRVALESGSIPYLDHYVRAGARLPDIRRATREAGEWTCVMQLAVKAAAVYLPPSSRPRDPPPVAMVLFAPDARGYSPIVLDALFAQEMKRDTWVRFLGHEFHHFYRNLLAPRLRANCVEGLDAAVFWALDQLQAEGVADQVNVRLELESGGARAPDLELYRKWMEETPDRLRRFESLVLEAQRAGHSRSTDEVRREIGDVLPRSGHPNGYYMANLIQDVSGKERLLEHLSDPTAFVRDYQDAARRRSASRAEFVFSSQLEASLQRLQARLAACEDRER